MRYGIMCLLAVLVMLAVVSPSRKCSTGAAIPSGTRMSVHVFEGTSADLGIGIPIGLSTGIRTTGIRTTGTLTGISIGTPAATRLVGSTSAGRGSGSASGGSFSAPV